MEMRWMASGMLAGAMLAAAVPARATNCAELLARNAYRCAIVTASGPAEACVVFSIKDVDGGLSLSLDGAPAIACACKHSGSLSRPRFEASAEIGCAGRGQAFVGKASRTKIKKVFVRQLRGGGELTGECVLDPACGLGS